MSTALGIASVTHVLKDLLNDGLINNNVDTIVDTVVNVSSVSPGQLETGGSAIPTQLNMFMYRVTPNIGWANVGYPFLNGEGEIIDNPPLAFDLHYLLTAYGEKELHAEILLGYAAQILHENPVLDRGAIRISLSSATAANPAGRLPASLSSLSTSDLSEQIEQIKITPENINTEEMSKLWTAFQSKYRPCSAYVATVVLIESNRSTISPLPVLKRTFYTMPFKQPIIEKILSQTATSEPIKPDQRILPGHLVVIRGRQLKRDPVAVLLNGKKFTPVAAAVSDTELKIKVSASLRAGIVGVQVAHHIKMGTPPEDRVAAESNLMAFVLSPSISNFSLTEKTSAGGIVTSAKFSADITPGVLRGQRITLLLHELSPPPGEDPKSYSFILPASFLADEEGPVGNLTFSISNVKEADYLVRIRVDGSESPLETVGGKFTKPNFTM